MLFIEVQQLVSFRDKQKIKWHKMPNMKAHERGKDVVGRQLERLFGNVRYESAGIKISIPILVLHWGPQGKE